MVCNIEHVPDGNLHLCCLQDDAQFMEAELDSEATEELEMLLKEIERRIPVFGPLHESGEWTNRGAFHSFKNVTSL